jgi:two-component system, NarL family, nitrate/nitrite response regulator NarL
VDFESGVAPSVLSIGQSTPRGPTEQYIRFLNRGVCMDSSVATGVGGATGRMARVVVVERMVLVAETFGIAMGGAVEARAVVVGETSSTGSVAREVCKARPSVVFVDVDLGPHVDCPSLVESLVEHALQVVALTDRGDDDVVLGECLRRGAVGALCKSGGLAPVLVALRQALARQPVMDVGHARSLMAMAQSAKDPRTLERRRLSTLTIREREVLTQLMAGATAPQIARSWCLSEATVRTQIKSILAKLEVGTQLAAVAAAHRHGWTAPTATSTAATD